MRNTSQIKLIVYDALYTALAMKKKAKLVSLDGRYVEVAKKLDVDTILIKRSN